MSEAISERRHVAVEAAVTDVKRIAPGPDVGRDDLQRILAVVKDLAARRELWGADDFPSPEAGVGHARHLVREYPDQGYALYLNVMRRGNRTPIHNHTTWACIAAVEGTEHNYLYRRVGDDTRPGHAEVEEHDVVVVKPGTGIALAPDDIHAVEIRDDDLIRHLHMYGRAVEALTERVAYDPQRRAWSRMGVGVKTRR